ncbi:MAG TPA: type VII secretion protein EccCb [Pseudonocardiaceae bacterium]|nr:type VII secretion protein EccCb [Pseudonocardiaceae bacterium]
MPGRYALLVATAQYTDPRLRRLRAPVGEAQHLRELLLDTEVGGFDTVGVVLDDSKAEIERRIEELFAGRGPDDLVLLYLSGHGLKNDHDKLFFAACNTELDRPYATAVAASAVQGMLEESQAGKKAVLLDCCYSGAFSNGLTARSSTAIDYEAQLLGRGTYVITATSELEYAYEGNELVWGTAGDGPASSVFTAAVIKGLETGLADGNDDGLITADELYSYVYDRVREANVPQTPTRHDRIKGDFRIATTRRSAWRDRTGIGSPTLGTLLSKVVDSDAQRSDSHESLATPIGNAHQPGGRVEPVRLELTGQTGHLVVVGRLFSGKSTLLHTLILGLAYTRSPEDVQFYCLDWEGRLGVLANLAHVRAVVNDDEPQLVDRVLEQLRRVIAARRAMFRQQRIFSMNDIRRRRRRGELPGGEFADVFLVVDCWEGFAARQSFVDEVVRIASVGLGFGVHVVVTTRHWSELPDQIVRLLLGRIELLLDDPADSRVNPAMAATLPEVPGWGLYAGRRFQVALPRQDGTESGYDLVSMVESMVDSSADAWLGYSALTSEDTQADNLSILQMLGIPGDPATFDVWAAWRERPRADRFKVPIGVGDRNQLVQLDIKEAAMGGMGPHGLCVGATGSGKSELLRTLVLALALTHSPQTLNMVLVDFKGGATFHSLARLPHVVGTITNLAEDLSLVDRMHDALLGELARRREILAAAGVKELWEYETLRQSRPDLEPLPALFICIDEFSEMLLAKPDFLDVFLQIGRAARSYQVHLLLASQRLEEGKLRGLDTSLSYRIGLRTFSASESRLAIGVPDAYELPARPGSALLAVQGEQPTRFRSTYVSGPYRDDHPEADGLVPTLLDVLVDRLAEHGLPGRPVWLPPLDRPVPLGGLLPPLVVTAERGLTAAGPDTGSLTVPIGVVDRPAEQSQDALTVDLSGGSGHVAVVGGPQSGKSTLLRTLIMATALTHTPAEVQFYCLDFGGGLLTALAGLPHVGGVAGRLEAEKVRRTVAELELIVDRRERRFLELGIDTMAAYRLRRQHDLFDDPHGDVFLVIDGWQTVRQEFETVDMAVVRLAGRGPSYGVHVVVTASRWAEIRPALKDLLRTRLELRLGEPAESEVHRRIARNVPDDRPGRGITADGHHFLAALPRIDDEPAGDPTADLLDQLRHTVTNVAANWHGPVAPRVRLLPDRLPYADLPLAEEVPRPGLIPVGVNEDELATVFIDFDADPHFVAFADTESGKTNLLRTIVRGITTHYRPTKALILLVDYRRTMLDFVNSEHVLGYAASGEQLTGIVRDVRGALAKRLPGPHVTPDQLRDNSWWRGPKLFVVVDDYDLVVTASGNPLQPLSEFLAQAKDIGLHMIVARRTGGASRSTFDPIIGRMKEIGTPGWVGNGSRDEGALWGGSVRPTPQPPGRGVLVTRKRAPQQVQLAWLDPEA